MQLYSNDCDSEQDHHCVLLHLMINFKTKCRQADRSFSRAKICVNQGPEQFLTRLKPLSISVTHPENEVFLQERAQPRLSPHPLCQLQFFEHSCPDLCKDTLGVGDQE
ncbi:hypothetical protein AOLI_G00317520 [Acnodon oligacanthus]